MDGGSHSNDSQSDSKAQEEYLVYLEAALENLKEQDTNSLLKQHYFVPGKSPAEEDGRDEEIGFNDGSGNPDSIDRFLVLPQEDLLVHAPLPRSSESQIDYSKNHILTFDEFVASLEAKTARKQAIMKEAQVQ